MPGERNATSGAKVPALSPNLIRRAFSQYGVFVALGILWIGLNIITDGIFLSVINLGTLMRQSAITGIMALGMSFVIMSGETDLGVGSVLAMCAVIVGNLMISGMNIFLSIAITLLVGITLGVWNGYWVAHQGILAFIVTVSTMNIARGTALVLSGGMSVSPVPEVFSRWLGIGDLPLSWSYALLGVGFVAWLLQAVRSHLGSTNSENKGRGMLPFIRQVIVVGAVFVVLAILCTRWKGMPMPTAIWLVLGVIAHIILQHTRFGRHVVASGGNAEAAHLAGVNVKKIRFMCYVIMGIVTAIGALVFLAYLGGVQPSKAGDSTPLDAIASVMIGGATSIPGTIVGALIIGTIDNGMTVMGVSPFYQMIVKGLVLLFAVYIDVAGKKRVA
jgi:D-xylose transport system permease protein